MLFNMVFFLLFGLTLYGQEYPVVQATFSDTTHDGYPYWLPFGEQLVYSRGTNTTCFSVIAIPAGEACKNITGVFAQHARCSPDGKYFVFDGDFGTTMKIVSVNGGVPVRIDPDTIQIRMSGMPCWSPDSKKIAFTSGGIIFEMELESGKCRELFRAEHSVAVPYDWSPDGKFILADVRDTIDRRNSDIYSIDTEGEEHKQITFLEGRQVKPDLSPGGDLILFSSNHEGNAELYVMSFKGGNIVRLTYFEGDENNPGYDVEGDWSPDGKRIAFSSTRSGYWAIWIMQVDLDDVETRLYGRR